MSPRPEVVNWLCSTVRQLQADIKILKSQNVHAGKIISLADALRASHPDEPAEHTFNLDAPIFVPGVSAACAAHGHCGQCDSAGLLAGLPAVSRDADDANELDDFHSLSSDNIADTCNDHDPPTDAHWFVAGSMIPVQVWPPGVEPCDVQLTSALDQLYSQIISVAEKVVREDSFRAQPELEQLPGGGLDCVGGIDCSMDDFIAEMTIQNCQAGKHVRFLDGMGTLWSTMSDKYQEIPHGADHDGFIGLHAEVFQQAFALVRMPVNESDCILLASMASRFLNEQWSFLQVHLGSARPSCIISCAEKIVDLFQSVIEDDDDEDLGGVT